MGLLDVWASEGDIAEPELTKIKIGWEFAELPPHDYMNWIERNFGEKINHILANGISKWHQQNEYDEGSIVNHNKTIWFANNLNSNSEPSDANVDWTKIRDGAPTFFPTPFIIEPINGGFIVNGDVTLEVFDNHQFYLGNPTEVVLSIAENEQFSGQILETVNYTGNGVYTINHQFIAGTVYYIRSFLQNEDYVGQKSEVVVASTAPAASDIATPTLTVEGAPNEVPESPLLSVSEFVDNNSETTYQSTQIQIIKNDTTIFSVFEDISSNWEYTIPTGLLDPETEYTFRVRHIGEDNNASEFVEVVGVTLDMFGEPLMVVAHSNSPNVTAYEYDIASFTTITGGDAPDGLPNAGYGVAFSPDGSLCVVGHFESPRVTAYTVVGNSFTKIEGSDAPDALPGTGRSVAFSPDGSLCVVGHSFSPNVTVHAVDGNSFTKIEGSDVPDWPGTAWDVAFSPDGSLFVLVHSGSPYVEAYTVDGNSFTRIEGGDAPDALPSDGWGVAFSPDGSLCVVAHADPPYVTAYTVVGNSFTKIEGSDAPDALPSTGRSVAFSPDGSLCVVGHSNSPGVTAYTVDGNSFTKIEGSDAPDALPGWGFGVAFSPDGSLCVVAHQNSPHVTAYTVDGNSFTKIEGSDVPDALPNTGYGVAFSPTIAN